MSLVAVGMNTYAGGMQVAVERKLRWESLGSIERWRDALRLRKIAGLKTIDAQNRPSDMRADLIYANPPCSRFSCMSFSKFKDDDRAAVTCFTEIQELIDVGTLIGATTLWWESGPLAASMGLRMIEDGRQILEREWQDDCTALVCSIELANFGVPQRRPRTHVLWRRGKWGAPSFESAVRPFAGGPLAWLDSLGLPDGPPCGPGEDKMFARWGAKSVSEYVDRARSLATFQSTKPKIIRRRHLATPSVVSGRAFMREDHERWLSVPETASLMSYPWEAAAEHARETRWDKTLRLIAKNVSSTATHVVGLACVENLQRGSGGIQLADNGPTASIEPPRIIEIEAFSPPDEDEDRETVA